MTLTIRTILLALLATLVFAPALSAEDPAQPGAILAFVGVNVIPMDEDRLLKQQTVIVSDGRIDIVGNADDVSIPADAIRIDGEDRYLIPGLADLHVHLRGPDEYVNYLSYGVTTVMHMGSSQTHARRLLSDRQLIGSGKLLGPNIYTTEVIIDGDPRAASGAYRMTSPDEARKKVTEFKEAGFDFIKIYNNVPYEVFTAIVDEGRKLGLPVFGHLPRTFDPLLAISEGQNAVVHTEEFFFTYFNGPRSTKDMDRTYEPDLSTVPALIDALLESDVAVMPDLSFTFTNFVMWDSLDNLWMDAEMAYLHPNTAFDWQVSNINRRDEIENFVVRGQWKFDLMQELTTRFQQAGVLQVLGTDASASGLFPGKSAHRELTELVKAGLSNFDALSIGTSNAGEFVRRYIDAGVRFGQINPGYRADLVLLSKNPLEDIRNARNVVGVSVNGVWTDRSELDNQRGMLAARFALINDINNQVDIALEKNDAIDILRTLLATHGEDTEITRSVEVRVNSAGYGAAFEDRMERAREILEIGTKLYPDSANAWDSLAEIMLELGERQKSIEYYRHALKIDPDFSNATRQLEKILQDGN